MTRIRGLAAAVALAAAVVAGGGGAAAAATASVPAPFTFGWYKWCPSYQGQYGCATVQHPKQYDVAYTPGQVSLAYGHVRLAINRPAGVSGAFNSDPEFTVSVGQTVTVNVKLACVGSLIADWPAVWLDGTVGGYPAHGEIDLMEGLKGYAAWHYHYLSSAGQRLQVGHDVKGFSGCGWHTYEIDREPAQLTFLYDGRTVGTVTPADIGVPLATDPMELIFDYGSGVSNGPVVNRAVMVVGKITVAGPWVMGK